MAISTYRSDPRYSSLYNPDFGPMTNANAISQSLTFKDLENAVNTIKKPRTLRGKLIVKEKYRVGERPPNAKIDSLPPDLKKLAEETYDKKFKLVRNRRTTVREIYSDEYDADTKKFDKDPNFTKVPEITFEPGRVFREGELISYPRNTFFRIEAHISSGLAYNYPDYHMVQAFSPAPDIDSRVAYWHRQVREQIYRMSRGYMIPEHEFRVEYRVI